MLLARQFEQDRLQPLQTPFTTTKPLRHAEHPLLVQFRQLRGQEAQEVPLKYCPGRQLWQLFAVPWQVMQVELQRRQLVPDK